MTNFEDIIPSEIREKLNCRLIDATFSDLLKAIILSNKYDYQPKKEEIMSTDEFADYMSVDKRTLFRVIEKGELPDIRLKIGGKWKWNARGAWTPEVLRTLNSLQTK